MTCVVNGSIIVISFVRIVAKHYITESSIASDRKTQKCTKMEPLQKLLEVRNILSIH